jgi:hypothetical protein
MITLKLLDGLRDIEKKINQASSEVLNSKSTRALPYLKNNIRLLISESILNQPEIQSLYGGYLQGAFGSLDTPKAIQAIKDAVVNSISVDFTKFNKQLKGGFAINVQPADFINLLSIPEGHTLYEGGDLHWMDWLLTKGDAVIVANYYYDPKTGIGRTGLGNMKTGGAFRIPPEFSGIQNNNFITRALTHPLVIEQINKLLQESVS